MLLFRNYRRTPSLPPCQNDIAKMRMIAKLRSVYKFISWYVHGLQDILFGGRWGDQLCIDY